MTGQRLIETANPATLLLGPDVDQRLLQELDGGPQLVILGSAGRVLGEGVAEGVGEVHRGFLL